MNKANAYANAKSHDP